ncbi:hypothetical protein [Taklimakanibacter deserti]|uniref:hypothetical protein n=1 Tax=Taklimakanibacter deserti TaxID=2267839 RepID=UPI000E64EF8F
MKRPSNQSITRWLIFDFVRRNLYAFAFVFALTAALGVWLTNEPVSSRTIEGKFARWTAISRQGPPLIQVFVDLPDGRTTMVKAWPDWQPPAVGDAIRLYEVTLRWFGKSYSLAPPAQSGREGERAT